MRFRRLLNALAHPVTEYQVQKAKRAHKKRRPLCEVCQKGPRLLGKAVEVHHITPVHLAPAQAADPENLVTLCRLHHWLIGHAGNWRKHNPTVENDAVRLFLEYEDVHGITGGTD